jgi:Mg/Co/Ni transporter MgtE
MNNLLNRKELFWEVRPERIGDVLRDSSEWAIVRIFEYGELEDIADVIRLFGRDRVKNVLSNEKLNKVAAVMAFLFLGVDRYNRYASYRDGQ